MFSGIEQLKNGYLFDDRYSFKRKFIDSPAVWVFVNKLPDPKYLSPDRWKYYTINCNKELKKYIPTEADFAKKGEGSACQRFKGRLPSVTLPLNLIFLILYPLERLETSKSSSCIEECKRNILWNMRNSRESFVLSIIVTHITRKRVIFVL